MNNNDEIFLNALQKCRRTITRDFIAKAASEDQTKTIRKYLNSFGIMQLALFLQDLASLKLQKSFSIDVSEHGDIKQKRTQEGKKRADEQHDALIKALEGQKKASKPITSHVSKQPFNFTVNNINWDDPGGITTFTSTSVLYSNATPLKKAKT